MHASSFYTFHKIALINVLCLRCARGMRFIKFGFKYLSTSAIIPVRRLVENPFLIITFINFNKPMTKKINDDKNIPKNALLEPLNAAITKKADNKKIKSVLRYHLLKNIITAI